MLGWSDWRRVLDVRSIRWSRRLNSWSERRGDLIHNCLGARCDCNGLRCGSRNRRSDNLENRAHDLRGWCLRSGLFRGALRGRGRLFGLHRPNQAVTIRLPANSVRLGFFD